MSSEAQREAASSSVCLTDARWKYSFSWNQVKPIPVKRGDSLGLGIKGAAAEILGDGAVVSRQGELRAQFVKGGKDEESSVCSRVGERQRLALELRLAKAKDVKIECAGFVQHLLGLASQFDFDFLAGAKQFQRLKRVGSHKMERGVREWRSVRWAIERCGEPGSRARDGDTQTGLDLSSALSQVVEGRSEVGSEREVNVSFGACPLRWLPVLWHLASG